MCLLDATYRTTRYSLPLYFLCVPTNVNYMTVGTFIVESEDTPSIQEALSILKAWNLEWKPTYFMCDYANEEINALESVFPESFVYLCDFHREQSWDRWLKASHNNIGEDKAEILSLFRSMAHANTVEKFEMAKANLEESRLWTENSRLRKWFTDRWLDKHKRWVHAFRQMRYNASVNSTNGVERQNKCLKYEFLETKKAKSVSHLLTVLWNEFLPDLYQRYVRQNLSSSEEARAYDKDIPTFLRNRPGSVVKHCFKRWEDSVNISVDDIDEIGEGNFLVHSQAPGSSEVYTVNFSPQEFPIPSCTCEDWRKHHLICKHFCAIFRCTAWKWEHLPEAYRNNPFITLDDDILHNFSSYPVGKNIGTSESDSESETLVKGVQPLRMPSQSRLSKLRSNISSICELIKSYVYTCKDEDFLQRLCNNLHNTTETLRDTLCERNEFVVDEEKSMTHIATKKVRRLSLSKRKKGTGRHGLSADVLRSHSSKGVEDLLNRENDEGKVEEEVITIGDNDPCVLDTGVRSILKKRRSNSTTKKRVHFSDLCSSYEHEDLQQKIIMDCNQALQEVKKLWSLERGTGYVVGKVDDFNVTDTDIRSLYGTRWVTDQVMDAYLAYIVHREIEKGNLVALYPSQTMRSIVEGKFSVQKCRQKLKLWEYSTIIGAVCQNYHWTLVIIDSGNRILTFLNPKQEGRSQLDEIKKNWCSYIKERRQMYKELEAEDDNWSVQTLKHSRQRDAFNCGVYCLMFADRYFLKEPLTNITDDSLSRAREERATSLMMYHDVLQDTRCPTCGFTTNEEVKVCKFFISFMFV
ncbi:uncharacterized protein LOC134252909 [Saccostrea cucullata]|uniref:uncharacterized protein LOC134252909 n=1 Tax=Saccostrea cuccullata TaxID=36930 RepID=UPI002ED0BC3C